MQRTRRAMLLAAALLLPTLAAQTRGDQGHGKAARALDVSRVEPKAFGREGGPAKLRARSAG
ncbi:MAG: hypothetical protein WAQ05_18355 [Rubrivivax sp.]